MAFHSPNAGKEVDLGTSYLTNTEKERPPAHQFHHSRCDRDREYFGGGQTDSAASQFKAVPFSPSPTKIVARYKRGRHIEYAKC